ncbi:MAG: hypothetical protein BGO31_11145 [Bacteroidetes bacterium 43-16]|nr:MAG: hypothetical protein BGO31_11145 [Bacteroidetes bacterium 43-16]
MGRMFGVSLVYLFLGLIQGKDRNYSYEYLSPYFLEVSQLFSDIGWDMGLWQIASASKKVQVRSLVF